MVAQLRGHHNGDLKGCGAAAEVRSLQAVREHPPLGHQGDVERVEVRTKSERMSESISVVRGLAPLLGYATAAELAKEALIYNHSIEELVLSRGLLREDELARALSPAVPAGLQ